MTFAVVVPTWLALGQESLWSCVMVQSGVAVGLPTMPGGRLIVRSLTSSVAEVKPMWTLKSLFAPAFGLVGAADSP